MIHHIALRFAYDGHAFAGGYARQPDERSVEDAILAAARKEGYLAGSWRTGSRTDKGVSAFENVAALAVDRPHLSGLVPSLQNHCPDGLWITGAALVEPDWNPRHHALRTYRYLAPNLGEELAPMRGAARLFQGEHNVAGFARVDGGRNPVRQIKECSVEDSNGSWLFEISSPGFLWNQVRRMVDAMLKVGQGKLSAADIEQTLATGKIHPGMKLAPAAGLFLHRVRYTPELNWLTEAGSLHAEHLQKSWQAAQVQASLMNELSGS